VKLGTQIQPSYHIFSLEELKEATKSFEQSAFLGEGAIGKVSWHIFKICIFVYKCDTVNT
jgi:hypothetical protein